MRKPNTQTLPKEAKEIVAVDFDGTLHFGNYPIIREPNVALIDFIKENQDKYIFILWTMREGKQLEFAKEWIKEQGIKFDYYNDNVPWLKDKYRNNPRKVYADYYIDDHNAPFDFLISGRLDNAKTD